MNKILLIEDDEMTRTQMKWGMQNDYTLELAADRFEAVKMFKQKRPSVVTLDLGLPPHENDTIEGFCCLKEILDINSQAKIIIISGKGERENALKAIELGAYDFFQKPIDLEILKVIINRAFHLFSLEEENIKLKKQEQLFKESRFEKIIGSSKKMNAVFHLIRKVSGTEVTVLITGESGTGKELTAQAIHQRSLRKNGPFIPINCANIPENLLESELFGYEKGAFTDAKVKKIGLVEKAFGGTLFLDEIGELSLSLQVKLLRFIQERTFKRLGGEKDHAADVRLITATNTDLKKAIVEKAFRQDLYFRINVININLPPLREREDDIILIAKNFLMQYNNEYNKNIKGFTQKAFAVLKGYHWPGNVRELQNTIAHGVLISEDGKIKPEDVKFLNFDLTDINKNNLMSLKDARMSAEMEVIQKALSLYDGNISRSAQALKVTRPTLHDLLKKYDMKS